MISIFCICTTLVGHVRLIGNIRDGVGAIELLYPEIGWTGICADSAYAQLWMNNVAAAQVVCRQLGYQGGRPYIQK